MKTSSMQFSSYLSARKRYRFTRFGTVVTLLIAEGRDDPARFNARPDAEKDAMKILALDEYYGSSVWEGPPVG